MKLDNKKGQGAVFAVIYMAVALLISLIVYVIVVPIMAPFLDVLDTDPFTTFLLLAVPFWLLLGLIISIVVSGRGA